MKTHRIGTREEWRSARLALLEAEKDLTHRSDELAQRRQELPWVPVTKAYRFETDDKVVIRATSPERQIRAELKPVAADATRVVVVTMRGSEVDRVTSGLVVEAIELRLRAAGYPL